MQAKRKMQRIVYNKIFSSILKIKPVFSSLMHLFLERVIKKTELQVLSRSCQISGAHTLVEFVDEKQLNPKYYNNNLLFIFGTARNKLSQLRIKSSCTYLQIVAVQTKNVQPNLQVEI